MIDTSIVLIARNQEWNVARLIESVILETRDLEAFQIILVDSASVDQTAEIACTYPINVVRLHPDQPLSAAAGRYVGYLQTSGKFVLFLDGDMSLCPGWLRRAIVLMHERPDIACITGFIIERPIEAMDAAGLKPESKETSVPAQEILASGGAALYQRSVLEEVGPFNPFFISDEEPELCLRIRHAGYKVMSLGIPVAYHFTAPCDKILSIFGRRQRKLYLGMGQIMRAYLGKPLFWNYIFERGYGCSAALAIIGIAILTSLSIATQSWFWLGLAVFLSVGYVCFDALRKKSIYRTFYSLLKRLVILEGTLYGFFMHPHVQESYPARVDVLKTVEK